MQRTDEQLMADYRAGDALAFRELVDRHLKPIYNFAFRLIGNVPDAEDVTQEIFVKVWKNTVKYQPERSFKAWLYVIARRTVIDWARRKKKQALNFSQLENEDGESSPYEMVDPKPLPDEVTALALQRATVAGAVTNLSAATQKILAMRFHDGMTFAEIGQALGQPLNTVKSICRRGVKSLGKLLR